MRKIFLKICTAMWLITKKQQEKFFNKIRHFLFVCVHRKQKCQF